MSRPRPERPAGTPRRALARLVGAALAASLLAGCTGGPGTSGPVPTGTVTLPVVATPAPVSRAAAGQTPVGAKWDWGRYRSFSPYLSGLAGSLTFYEVVWCQVEPSPGVWSWTDVDQVVARTRALGIGLALKLRVGACWATTSGPQNVRGAKNKSESVPPKDLGQYADFVRAAVQRYAPKGVTEFAVENEINSEGMWRGTSAQYAELARTAAGAIRQADPAAEVVDPGISSVSNCIGIVAWLLDGGRDQDALRVYNTCVERRERRRDRVPPVATVDALKQVMAGPTATRALDMLATVERLTADGVFDVRQVHFYEAWENVPVLMAWLHTQVPAGTPLEAWEAGQYWVSSPASPEQRAVEVAKTVTLLLAGGARRVMWLPLAFDPTGRNADEPRYSLLDPSGAVRPAGAAVADLAGLARGATVVPVTTPGLQGVVLTQGTTSSLVVWSVRGDTSVRTAGLPGATVRPLAGSPSPAGATVSLTDQPVVVTATATYEQMLELLR